MIPVKARFLWVGAATVPSGVINTEMKQYSRAAIPPVKYFDCHNDAAAWQRHNGGDIYIWVWGEDDE